MIGGMSTELLIPLCVVGAVGFWCLICYALSWVSGWQVLMKHYGTAGKPSGKTVYLGIATLNSVQYKGVLSGIVSPDGLYLETLFLFAVGASPLLIPWTAFQKLPAEKILWGTNYRFNIRAGADTVELAVSNAEFAHAVSEWARSAGAVLAR